MQLLLESAAPSKLEQAFQAFHAAHPLVYLMLARLATDQVRQRGPGCRISIKALYEQVRTGRPDMQKLRMDNSFTAYYARLLMQRNPSLQGCFRLKQQRQQATFGPSNRALETGEHRS